MPHSGYCDEFGSVLLCPTQDINHPFAQRICVNICE